LKFGERPERGLFDAGDSAPCGCAEAERDGHGFIVIEQQRRKGGSRAELIAAGCARSGVDGVAETTEAVCVAAEGSWGDSEAFAEGRAGPVTLGLEEGKKFEKAG
jgi:hypothetical protein